MSATGKLFSHKEPYAVASTEELFIRAMRENCAFHYGRNETYRHILDEAGFSPEQLKTEEDLARLPVLPTLYFKRHTLFTLPERRLIAKVTSSGTGGKKSHVGFDLKTLWRELNMVLGICKYHRLWSAKPTRYVIFGYRPRKNSLGAAKSAFAFTLLAPAISRVYALESSESGIRLDMDGLKKRLIRYAKGKLPVRTMGFPAYTYFLLRQMKEEGISVKLLKGSMICLGGGWKQFYAERVEKEDFYKLAHEVLGVDESHIVEFFGAVEHPILYTDCRAHHFHVPVYARVIIRDVDTLAPVGYERAGLVNLLTPAIVSMPLLSVLTDDIGVLHKGPCPCGCDAPYLEIRGRVGVKDIITCAQGAEEFLKGEGR